MRIGNHKHTILLDHYIRAPLEMLQCVFAPGLLFGHCKKLHLLAFLILKKARKTGWIGYYTFHACNTFSGLTIRKQIYLTSHEASTRYYAWILLPHPVHSSQPLMHHGC